MWNTKVRMPSTQHFSFRAGQVLALIEKLLRGQIFWTNAIEYNFSCLPCGGLRLSRLIYKVSRKDLYVAVLTLQQMTPPTPGISPSTLLMISTATSSGMKVCTRDGTRAQVSFVVVSHWAVSTNKAVDPYTGTGWQVERLFLKIPSFSRRFKT